MAMRRFGTVVAVAAIGFFTAATASAAPDVTGQYHVENSSETWTVTSCGVDCVDVNSSGGHNRHLHLNDSRWVSVPFVGSVHCPVDNSEAAAEMTTTVNEGFTEYNDHTIRVIGTCENGYSFIGQAPDVSGVLVKQS